MIKEYFLDYRETLSNDFVLSGNDGSVELLQRDIANWQITFVDTGLAASVGQRLRAVRNHVGDEPFLANYGDILTDAPLERRIDKFLAGDAVASFMCVRPRNYSFHLVRLAESGLVTKIDDVGTSDLWINGGYFIFRPEIFDYLGPGEELVEEPFARLILAGRLQGDPLDGFWAPMDTLKDVQALQVAFDTGRPPWAIWQAAGAGVTDMRRVRLDTGGPHALLVIGAHADDVEIGAGATILRLLAEHPGSSVLWIAASSTPLRAAEARASAAAFSAAANDVEVMVEDLPDGRLPSVAMAVKDLLESVKARSIDLILAPHDGDAHQDHRLMAETVSQTFRHHLVAGYEIPKWDGDMGRPNLFVDIDADTLQRKIDLLQESFPSQHDQPWWGADTFRALPRLRGIESATHFAEGFFCRKIAL